jgi:hypothetical protein
MAAERNLLVYGNYSTGYLVRGRPGRQLPRHLPAEKVTPARRLQDDAARHRCVQRRAYYQKITDMQVFVQDITGSRIDNAGKAHVNGLELEASHPREA